MKVEWSRAASNDIRGIYNSILPENPSAARRILETLRLTGASLAEFPQRGRMSILEGWRELVIQNLPYLMVYRIHDGRVGIARVIHTARNWPWES